MSKLRTCTCCGEAKLSRDFTFVNGHYTATCRECGQWLTLFRQAFGRLRNHDVTRKEKTTAASRLWAAWHGGLDAKA